VLVGAVHQRRGRSQVLHTDFVDKDVCFVCHNYADSFGGTINGIQ
jgi:hypothetical protein